MAAVPDSNDHLFFMTNYLFSKFNKRGLVGLFWRVKFNFNALRQVTFHVTVILNDQMRAMCFGNTKKVLKQTLRSKTGYFDP